MPRDTDKAELLRTLRVHATRRVAQHARAAATALEEGGCDGMVRFIAALAGYGEAGALGARDRDEATIASDPVRNRPVTEAQSRRWRGAVTFDFRAGTGRRTRRATIANFTSFTTRPMHSPVWKSTSNGDNDGVGRPKFASTQAFATATVVGAIEGVCRDMLKSADVVPNLLLLFPPTPAATIPARKGE